jgi:hypothetical protein
LDKNSISNEEAVSVANWLNSCEEYSYLFNIHSSNTGKTLQDVIDFVNSESPQTDYSQIVAQFERVRKEMNKLEKLINKLL